MQKGNESSKHKLIEQTNTKMFIVLGLAAAVVSFSIVSSISLSSRMRYQSKVIDARVDAEKQLKTNYGSLQKLVTAYKEFDGATESVIGTNDNNSKIVLDALPSKYDFPALTASIDKIFILTGGISSIGITGSDLEATAEQTSLNPLPIDIPIAVSGTGSYDNIQKLITNFQLSIRPFKIVKVTFSGNQTNMSFTVNLITHYMPAKNLEIQLKEIE